tara:strand:+ start:257 stop:565 length:309 start_codon:yes stop_codon:yes gene_type:complete
MKFNENFKTTLPHVAMTTAYGVDTDRAKNVEMQTTLGIDPEHGGWFETYDIDTGGERFYAEGSLELEFDSDDSATLIGYDGCFELPDYIIEALEKKGVKIDL